MHVYESAPPSPRRKPLALPSPPTDGSTISLGQWKGKIPGSEDLKVENEPEEGTPEYIRRRFFPNAPLHNPNVAWMESSSPPDTQSSLRFDLTGTPIPPSLSSSLPTHLGLHHHADGAHAGYTLDDVFLLSRSSVPAQRATMLGVLARIARRIARMKTGETGEGMSELEGKEEELRKRIVAAGVKAMSERGSLGVRAVEVIWECVVGWDEEVLDIEGVELQSSPESAAIASLPLEFLLPQIATSLASRDLATESLAQLLAILHRLAQQSNATATTITTRPGLIANIVQTFLLTPIPPTDTSPLPLPSAIQLLITLALSSRSNALTLVEPADALLRFITMLPPSSPYPSSLATSLLAFTLRLYTALASYGLYSHIATTAAEHFALVGKYIMSEECHSRRLMSAWAGLLEAWTVCATDPHRTTPSHEILWSQVVGWGWGQDTLELRGRIKGEEEKDWDVWAALWRAGAAWLEGAKVNGIRAGETERLEIVEAVKSGFENGQENIVVLGVIAGMQRELTELGSTGYGTESVTRFRLVATYANTLMSALRLWLACLPPVSNGPLASPPFLLPFPQLSELCAKLVNHSLWSLIYSEGTPQYTHVFCRTLTALLSYYLRLSRRLPGISEDLWIAQALSILGRLLPGDEEFALQVVEDVTGLVSADLMASRGWHAPSVVWETGGISVIKPFLVHTLKPREDVNIGPTCMSPHSILLATTQRLPSASGIREFGLPARRDWTLSALDHLLRSGNSSVFKALPLAWNASEVEVTRASLLFAKIAREVLHRFALTDFVLTREEAVFGCMKVFMLEHGQPQNDSAEEVFRDNVVGELMNGLLVPYNIASSHLPSSPTFSSEDLEKVAVRFLGPSTPFYQFYTDFVALYDAISFSHPLFGRLLLPPTSMRYASDYRKHLWNDFGHVLKTIRTPVDQVISGDLKEYLWPVENDAQMIGSYLRSLVKGPLQGFVRLVAIHHLACNIWPDLQDGETWGEERASKLLRAVVEQGSVDVLREMVRYHQPKDGSIFLPPVCFEALGEWSTSRMACIERWGGKPLVERLEGLFRE